MPRIPSMARHKSKHLSSQYSNGEMGGRDQMSPEVPRTVNQAYVF